MKNVDFGEIKERISIVEACEMLGITGLHVHQAQLRGPCPLCHGEGLRKFAVTPSRNLWFSFCCEIGGDQISLVAKIKDIPLRDAAIWLSGDNAPVQKEQRAVPQEHLREGNNLLQPLAYLESDHPSVIAVGFDPRIAKELGIGFAPKGVARGHVLIPVREANGTLRGYVGLDEATFLPKDFMPPENVVPFKKKA